jgi:hypothetical protein
MTVCRLIAAIFLTLCTEAIGQTSFWPQSAVPSVLEVSSTKSATLGLKFYSDVPGSVTGVRFYKGPHNLGTHVGNLWSSTGSKLASVTFSGETASGWQQANFSSPVSITANTTYVISYSAPNGRHARDQYYSWENLSASSLHVAGSSPGVYTYGVGALFPSSTSNNSNYWVDVVFSPTTSQPPASVSSSFWQSTSTPGSTENSDTASVTLGLKFYSDVPGSVTGIRFYKGQTNTGSHIGTLWSSAGVKLASVTFSGETASGWQRANFPSPISIATNTTYVISYVAPVGGYSCDQYYSWSTLNAPPLHAADSSPGVYAYGSGALFPASTWNNSNYWVDVLFTPAGTSTSPVPPPLPPPSTYTISGNVGGSAATLTLSGAASNSTTASSTGDYSFTGLANGSYIVAPSKTGYTFTPSTASVSVNDASVSGLNFIATAVPIPIPHSVSLSWNPSVSSNIAGYNLYRAEIAGGAYTKLTASPLATTAFTDSSIASGRTYYYVATAVDSNNVESSYSNLATAAVPTP